MDIVTVSRFRRATSRSDLALAPGEVFMGGGTWLMSEPQPVTTGFVDLTTLGWPDLEITDTGLRIGATCTIATLRAWAGGRHELALPEAWRAASMIPEAADALLASFKIWHTATVGGNICRAFPAGAMISLAVGLDATAEVWGVDGSTRAMPVSDLVTGNAVTCLAPGEVLRAINIPQSALASRAHLKKIALAELGRSGAVVTGREDSDGSTVFVVTAAVERPVVLRFTALPDAATLRTAIGTATGFYSDPLGSADWRRAVSMVLGERIREELSA
ncbi:FAD binding domain-containing protein [Microbacterium sp. R86528]|uniref:FAD binding domain-containing protein n=1 Tax=Microbacterium sp. R86528 TaxID=3093864 RepID=UPI0037C63D86